MMRGTSGILLLFLIGVAFTTDKKKDEYDLGSRFKIVCNDRNIPIALRPMRMFSLSLVTSRVPENVRIEISSNNSKPCLMTKHHTICTYADSERYLNISCTDDYEFVFEIAEPLKLAHQYTHKYKYVEVDVPHPGDSGIISVGLTKELSLKVKELLARHRPNFLPIFSYTPCVQNIALFYDHFKIAVENAGESSCVVGVRIDGQVKWHYEKTVMQLTANTVLTYNYVNDDGTKLYDLPELSSYTIGVTVESDVVEELVAMQLQLSFIKGRGEEVTYNLTNFEKGVYPFRSIVHHPSSASKLRIKSSFDAFFYLTMHSNTTQIDLTEDYYLYTELEKEVSFTLTLDEFEDLATSNDTIKLVLSDPKLSDHIKFRYAQCETINCSIKGAESLIEQEFKPACKKVDATNGSCVMLVTVVNINYEQKKDDTANNNTKTQYKTPGHGSTTVTEKKSQIIGVLPYMPIRFKEIEMNKLHTGLLRLGYEAHFRVPKEKLENLTIDELMVEVNGAEAYIMYDPDCKRIYCADFYLHNINEAIPRIHSNDMLIILKGSGDAHYSFMIDTVDQSEFVLSDGYVFLTHMKEDQDARYFSYVIDDRKNDIEINCNAPDGVLTVYANVKKNEFPTESKYDFKSTTGQIFIPAEDIKDGKSNLLITLSRNQPKRSNVTNITTVGELELTILVSHVGSTIQAINNLEHYDTLRPQSEKTFVYDEINTGGSYGDVTIKIDPLVPLQKDKGPSINVFVGSDKYAALNVTNWNFQPILINDVVMKAVCKDLAKDLVCVVKIKLQNPGKEAFDFSYLSYRNTKPLELKDGEPVRIPASSIGKEIHMLYKVTDNNKPINIYAYSNEIKIVVISSNYKPEKLTETYTWPFPMFPSAFTPPPSEAGKERVAELLNQTGKFNHHIYFNGGQLKESFGDAAFKYLLLTIRQDSGSGTKKRGEFNQQSKGFLHVTASSGSANLREEDKMQFMVEGSNPVSLRYDIKELINTSEPTKHQIYFYNTQLSGQASIEFYAEADGMRASVIQVSQRSFVEFSNDVLKKVLHKYSSANSLSLIYTLRNVNPAVSGNYLVNLVTSDLLYHKLIMGTPTEFFIPKNTSVVFEFIDSYHQDFKLKVYRKEGLPTYKVKSCSNQQSTEDCMLEIYKARQIADPDNILNQGRSHELLINPRSKDYCKDCVYYFAFYATNEDIYGSVTVIGYQTTTSLIAGRAMTTEVEEDETDVYMFSTAKDMVSSLTITPLKGTLKVWITDVDSNGRQIEKTEAKKTVVEKESVEILLPKKDAVVWHGIHIQSREKEGSTYTLLLQHQDTVVNLEDGVGLNLVKKIGSISNFEYSGKDDSTLIVMSNVLLSVELTCPHELTLNDTSAPGSGNVARVDSINPEKKEDKNDKSSVVAEKLNHIDFSMVSKIRTFQLNPKICTRYRLTIRNDYSAGRFTVLVNSKDIVMLPVNTTMPGKLAKGSTQNYELPITEVSKIKVVLRMCLNGQVRLGLTQIRSDLTLSKFQNEFQTNGMQSHYANTFQVHQGMLYLSVKSLSKPVDFTIEVFIIDKGDVLPTIVSNLPHRNIDQKYVGEVDDTYSGVSNSVVQKAKGYLSSAPKLYEYDIIFSGMNVEDDSGQNYKVSYVVAESQSPHVLKKFKDCRGALMSHTENPLELITLTRVEHTVVGHSIKPSASDAEEKLNNYLNKIVYRTKLQNSYITILPIILPVLPGYVSMESYKTIHLNKGAMSFGPLQLVYSFVGMVHDGVQQTTNLSNGLILNVLVLLTIVILGMGSYMLGCCISAGCIYGWRMQRYQMLRTHQPSEHELRHNRHAENNSLDMLENPTRQSEYLPTVVEVVGNRFDEPQTPAV